MANSIPLKGFLDELRSNEMADCLITPILIDSLDKLLVLT